MSTGRFDRHKFYVHVYLNPLEPGSFACDDITFKHKPIYVGKGCGKRVSGHLEDAKQPAKKSNREKAELISKIINSGNNPLVFKVKEGLTNNEALTLERKLINKFGISLEGGILANISKGGVYHKRQNNAVEFIRAILEEEKARLQKSIQSCLDELDELPRGSIQYKTIRNGDYAYLAYRKAEKVKYKYIGKKDGQAVREMKTRLENRAIIEDKLNTKQSKLTDIERTMYFLDLYFDYGDLPDPDENPAGKLHSFDQAPISRPAE